MDAIGEQVEIELAGETVTKTIERIEVEERPVSGKVATLIFKKGDELTVNPDVVEAINDDVVDDSPGPFTSSFNSMTAEPITFNTTWQPNRKTAEDVVQEIDDLLDEYNE